MHILTRAPCTIQASGVKIPRLTITPAYSGGFLLLPDFQNVPVVLDLATLSFEQENIPILWHHHDEIILGHTTALKCDGRAINAEAELTAYAETYDSAGKRKAEEVVSKSKLGQRWEASVGTGVIATQDAALVPEGEKVSVNGRDFTGPLYLIKNIRIVEISLVPVGADRDTGVTITASGLLAEGTKMGFTAWLTSKGIDQATVTADTVGDLRAQYLAENPEADIASLDAEIASLTGISAGGGTPPAPTPVPPAPPAPPSQVQGSGTQTPPGDDGKNSHVNNPGTNPGTNSAKQSAADFLQKFRGQTTITASGTSSKEPSRQEIATAALLLSRIDGKKLEAAGLPARAIDAATSMTWRRAGFHTVFREALRASGISAYDMGTRELVQAGLSIMRQNTSRCVGGITAAGLSSDYTMYVFKDTIDKAVMTRYEDAKTPLSDIAKDRTTRDFRPVTDFRLGLQGSFAEVGPSGDPPMARIIDEGWTCQIKKYELAAKISFEQLCNDDCNVLDDISDYFVRDAVQQQEKQIAQAILGGIGAGFYTTVTQAPFGFDGLKKAISAFRKIKTLEGETMDREAQAVLIPTALEADAKIIYQSTEVNETTTQGKRSGNKNIYSSHFTPIVSARLDSDSGISGGSDTNWFLLADQKASPIVAKCYMEGFLAPQVKTSDLTDNFDIKYLAMYTFAAKLYDSRGGVYCKATS